MSDTRDEAMTSDFTGGLPERLPCSDERCTGIFGPDGRCGTCGRELSPRDGETVAEALARLASCPVEAVTAPAPREARKPESAPVKEIAASAVVTRDVTDDAERVPCTDDMCTGVLGADGRCGTCGRAGPA